MNDEQKQEDRAGAGRCQAVGGCYGMSAYNVVCGWLAVIVTTSWDSARNSFPPPPPC